LPTGRSVFCTIIIPQLLFFIGMICLQIQNILWRKKEVENFGSDSYRVNIVTEYVASVGIPAAKVTHTHVKPNVLKIINYTSLHIHHNPFYILVSYEFKSRFKISLICLIVRPTFISTTEFVEKNTIP